MSKPAGVPLQVMRTGAAVNQFIQIVIGGLLQGASSPWSRWASRWSIRVTGVINLSQGAFCVSAR